VKLHDAVAVVCRSCILLDKARKSETLSLVRYCHQIVQEKTTDIDVEILPKERMQSHVKSFFGGQSQKKVGCAVARRNESVFVEAVIVRSGIIHCTVDQITRFSANSPPL
jgi:hypothetical protein